MTDTLPPPTPTTAGPGHAAHLDPAGEAPQGTLSVRDAHGTAIATCSLWWKGRPVLDGQPTGYIGHFSAANEPAALDLLDRACKALADHGCKVAVGPIDGTTWHRYRLVTAGSAEPAFFLEPSNPSEWPQYFRGAGFRTLARYQSRVTDSLSVEDSRAARAEERLKARGFRVRPLDPAHLGDELTAIHRIAVAAFTGAFLYQPISLDSFRESMAPVLPHLNPELVLIAEHRDRPAGFLFAIPDALNRSVAGAQETVVLKTVAVLPGRKNAGLGGWLSRHFHRRAAELGYRRVIHALIHEANSSLNLHRAPSTTLREYTLFSKPL